MIEGQEVVVSNVFTPTIFFALSFPVLTDRIFLCLDFTHRISSIYSNIIAPTENKQRTVKSPFSGVFCIDPLKILCLVRSLVLSKRLFRNHITKMHKKVRSFFQFLYVGNPYRNFLHIYQSNFIFFHCLKCLCLCALTLNRKSL